MDQGEPEREASASPRAGQGVESGTGHPCTPLTPARGVASIPGCWEVRPCPGAMS